jgi:hypothetical protein
MATLFQATIRPKSAASWALVTLSVMILVSCTTSGNENSTQSVSNYAPQSYHGAGSNR